MYCINDFVSYSNKGIFQIKEIIKRNSTQHQITKCYVLYANQNGVETSIITPTDNPSIRHLNSAQQILQLIQKMPSIEPIWYDDKRIREDKFQLMLTSGNIKEWAQLAKSIYVTRQKKATLKKSISDKDKQTFIIAEDLLYNEIAIACQINRDDVAAWIKQVILS